MAADTKERIVGAGAELFRRQGYTGTGVKQIVAEAKAPFGSLYHFFPGGKGELGAAVIRWSGAMYAQLVEAVIDPAPDILTAVDLFFSGAAEHLVESDYEDACPIATVALEVASTSEPLREATAEVFDSWIDALAARFRAAGIADGESRELAIAMLSQLEGAFVLSRAKRSTEPLEVAGRAMTVVVGKALAVARVSSP
jgi:AcrR family transcriptional regulator